MWLHLVVACCLNDTIVYELLRIYQLMYNLVAFFIAFLTIQCMSYTLCPYFIQITLWIRENISPLVVYSTYKCYCHSQCSTDGITIDCHYVTTFNLDHEIPLNCEVELRPPTVWNQQKIEEKFFSLPHFVLFYNFSFKMLHHQVMKASYLTRMD